jgi:signal transduction histidine kinase
VALGALILALFSGLLYIQNRRVHRSNIENEALIDKLQIEIQHREAAEKDLAQSDRMREMLLDIITHDLKNPAGVIYGLAEMARQTSPDDKYLESIYTASERLLEVLNNTTLLCQAAFGEKIPMEHHNLLQMMNAIVEEFSSSLEGTGMKLDLIIPADLNIHANALISEAFKNYISNAIKYAAEGKEIVIEATGTPESLLIQVKDRGPTIPEADRKQIFERTIQLAQRKSSGRGLGLAIVKRIAETHGGDVWVEPNSPRGNIFCLRLPA